MKAYATREQLVDTMSLLWDRIFAMPEISARVADAKLVAKFRFTDHRADLFIDLSAAPLRYYWDAGAAAPFDVEMILDSDTAHAFWMRALNVPLAIASRRIVAKGSVPKALRLLPALGPAFDVYRGVLAEKGRTELLTTAAAPSPASRTTGALRRLFGGRRRAAATRGDVLPRVVLTEAAAGAPAPARRRSSAAPAMTLSPLELYRTMRTIRRFEEHLAAAFKAGELATEAIHLSIGQEAVAAAVCGGLRDTDYLNTTHRGHGHIIAKGADVRRMMAELYGKADGLCRGRGGSMHVTDGAKGVLGANGIVGAGYLLAFGAGFTIKHHHASDDISVVLAGDGSVNQGMFHEAMNLVALFELPVLVVIENNGYGEFTPVERHSAVPEIHKRAAAYAIEAVRLDGGDAVRLHAEISGLIAQMRRDGRPRLVECMTYRHHGHMEGESETYRTAEEKAHHRAQDALDGLRRTLAADDEDAVRAVDEAVDHELAQAVAFARSAPSPRVDEVMADIYAPEPTGSLHGSFTVDGPTTSLSVAGAINRALAEELARDPAVFLWGEDVALGGYFNVSSGLVERFGKRRIIDTPISEAGFTGGAVGAAMTGMRPVVEILFADFLTCCMDPILNQAAKLRYMTGGQVSVPLTIRTPVGSGIGMAAQHSQSMERFFTGIPGLLVVAPSDPFTCAGLLKSAIRSNNPVLFFEHKLLYAELGEMPEREYTLPIGKARVVRAGGDVTLVTYLLGVGVARQAADLLAQAGIQAEIIDLVSLYPLDIDTVLASVAKTGRLVTLEEGWFTGSIGSEVISQVALAAFGHLRGAPIKLAAPDCPVPYAKDLETALMPSPEQVARRIQHELRA